MRAFIYLFIFGNLKRELILSLSKIVVVLPLNNMCGLRTHNNSKSLGMKNKLPIEFRD